MSIVAIIGAGTLGGSLAHKLASRDRFDEVRLIDELRDVAAGKALDIQQAAAVETFHTTLRADGDLAAAVGADVVVITGPVEAPETEWSEGSGLPLLDRVAGADRRTVIVCAGASHRRLIERGVGELGIPRRRLIGSAPEGLRAALMAIVALELGCPASEVTLTVLGAPPEHTVVPWSQATVGGLALDQRLPPAALARLREKSRRVWPPGPYALAAAAGRVSEAVIDGAGRSPACFVVLDGELGARGRSTATRVELGTGGVVAVTEPSLNAQERVELETALTG